MWDSMTELAMAKAKQQDLIAQAAVARQILGADDHSGQARGMVGYQRGAGVSTWTAVTIFLRRITAHGRRHSTASRV